MIKHILADGQILNDITGHKVPRTNSTEAAYRILADILEGGYSNEEVQQRIRQNYG